MDRKQLGRLGMSYAIAYYTREGYTISVPLNDTQWYDLIIEKDGIFQTVQCKATATMPSKIDLRSTGGTNGATYDIATNHPIDKLFCVDADGNLYDIPMKDIVDFNATVKSITLKAVPMSQGFQTYKYLVRM